MNRAPNAWVEPRALAQLQAALAQRRLVLLLSPDVAALRRQAHALADALGLTRLALSPCLSAHLLGHGIDVASLTPAALRAALEACLDASPGATLCTDTDLLFDPALRADPLALFEQLSARRAARAQGELVVTWHGALRGSTLTYALPEHAHYRTWRVPPERDWIALNVSNP